MRGAQKRGIALMLLAALLTCLGQLCWKLGGGGELLWLLPGFALYGCGALLMIVAMVLDVVCFRNPYKFFYLLVSLFLFLPQLAVSARRLHDTGRTSKWLLWYYLALSAWAVAALVLSAVSAFGGSRDASKWALIVLCGGCVLYFVWGIVFLVWFCLPGTPGANKYGPDPKQDENAPSGRPGGPAAPGSFGETGMNPESEISSETPGSISRPGPGGN